MLPTIRIGNLDISRLIVGGNPFSGNSHVNGDLNEDIPAFGRIKGFREFCESSGIEHRVILTDLGNNFEENYDGILRLYNELEETYPDKNVGVFMPNDTHANILLNIIFRQYGRLPEKYCIFGFDNSPISREAIIPISTIGQQVGVMADAAMELLMMQINERRKRKPTQITESIHKIITPILINRETTHLGQRR